MARRTPAHQMWSSVRQSIRSHRSHFRVAGQELLATRVGATGDTDQRLFEGNRCSCTGDTQTFKASLRDSLHRLNRRCFTDDERELAGVRERIRVC